MRKINSLLMLVLLFCMSVSSAMADKRYSLVDFGDESGAWQEGSIQTDVPCALQNAVTASIDVLSGSSKSTYVDESAVFVFESAGQAADGSELYRLKNYATGQYVLDPVTGSTSTISYTESKARAFIFTVKDAVNYPSDIIEPGEGETQDWTSATTVTAALEGGVVLTRSDVSETTALSSVNWLLAKSSGSNPSFGHDYTCNVWVIYAVEELTGFDYLSQVMTEIYPDGRDAVAELYDVGDQPGQISQELYDELLAAYDNIFNLANGNTQPSAEECEDAYQRCLASIEAAKNGAVPVAEGYYYFRVNQKVDGNAREKNAAYDNGEYIRWTYKDDWELSETPNPSDAKYIWHIIPNTKDDRGGYFIQNVYTKRYVGLIKKSDTALPTTVEAEDPWLILPQNGNKNFFTVESVDLIADPVIGWNNTKCTAMHCPNWTDIVVLWSNTDTSGCAWRFHTVSEEMVKAIENSMEQYTLNDKLQKAYDEAEASYNGSRNFLAIGETGVNNLEVDGLVTSKDQLSSNAPDQNEGKDIGYLLDSDPSTFFHTDWHGEYDVEYHSLSADLSKAVSTLVVKMWRRLNSDWGSINNGSNNPAPKVVKVSASNDGGTTWDEIGNFDCDWSTTATFESKGKTVANEIGYCTITADKEYKLYQLEVVERTNGGTNKFINLGEIRFYEGPIQYSTSTSLYEAIPVDVRTAFENALSKAKSELEAELATQATIDELASTYEAWLANYPDPSQVSTLLEEAKAQAEAADESSDAFGYFEEGAGAELKATLETIEGKVKSVMTIDEINTVKAEIQAALDKFNSHLIMPTDGVYVYIQSTSKADDNNPPTDAYLYASKNGSAQVKWLTNNGDDLGERLNYVWKVEKNDEGKYRFLNMGTGEYMNSPKTLSAKLTTSVEADTCYMSLRSAKVAGSFNFVLDESLFVNAQPGSHNVVVWNSASGNDNSAFQFITTEIMDGSFIYETTKATQVITLPFDVVATVTEGSLYSVVGQTPDNKIYLKEFGSKDILAAGTPFVFVPADDMEGTSIDFETVAADFSELEFSLEAKTVNGLVGTLATKTLPAGKGKILGGMVALTDADETIEGNSGYFDAVPQISADEATTVYLESEGTLNAIHVINTAEDAELVNVYTLSGVKVRSQVKAGSATNNLPAGLYIVGSRKVIVK